MHAETVLYASLTDVEALEQLSDIGLAPECIPLAGMRDVVEYAVGYFRRSGRAKAPSRELLVEQWGHRLEQCGVELPDEDLQIDEVYTAIEYLQAQHALVVSQALLRETAVDMAQAEPHELVDRVHAAASQWHGLSMTLRDRSAEVEGIQGLTDSVARYEQRAAAPKVLSGMALGIPAVDRHTLGIHEGELASYAAGAKAGKSWSASNVARAEWQRQRETVLYTLENSVKMTYDRLACQTCGVDYRRYQKGECIPEEIERVKEWLHENEADLRDGLHVISPSPGRRTPAALINQAHSYNAKSVIIDQLSHVEHPDPGRKPRHEVVRDIVVELANLISTGRQLLPLLLNVQVNREGIAAASKAGRLEITHLAESAEIERGSSWVFGLMRSDAEVTAGMATLQTVASRRMDLKHWACAWEPWYGVQEALREVTL
ncbi:hypothetical protein E6R60_26285 [Streptomyces sp. A0642]|uniref:DnaB-like helicase C-terminal domain-containing protein n=1 Tax=Streptomyces sp. A0642 TaxID=2563100 RepID=UPI0010A2291B|nr:DnaB-like helicase C-terminal domain-containing protein [Streptomyces sp. A0642]THA72445.1 hypothetical protein E6R60_26285 [Streptomyces sp. A0642]